MTTETKINVKALCRKIAKQTDENDHTGAVVTLAQALVGAEKLADELVTMRKTQIDIGHITHEMYERRRKISKELELMAAAQFSYEDYAAIQGSY